MHDTRSIGQYLNRSVFFVSLLLITSKNIRLGCNAISAEPDRDADSTPLKATHFNSSLLLDHDR